MVKILRRLICRVIGHTPLPGVRLEMSIRYCCARCGAFAPGKFTTRKQ